MRVNLFRWAFVCVILLTTICLGCLRQLSSDSLGYITVLTYNTHLYAGSREEFGGLYLKNSLDDKQRAEKMIYKIVESRADIVALQEVWADGNQEWFCQKLKPFYPYCFVSGQKEDLKDFGKTGFLNTCGLVLLSKYKFIEGPTFFEFDRSKFKGKFQRPELFPKFKFPYKFPEQEYFARKGGIFATVELRPGGPKLRLGITQTHTGHGEEERNVEQLANATIKSSRFIDCPAIIMGDFNVHAVIKGSVGRLKEIFAKNNAVDAYRAVHPYDYKTDIYKDMSEENMSEDDYTIDRQKNVLHQEFFGPSADPKIDRDRIDYVFVKKSGGGLEVTPIEAEVLRDWKYEAVWEKRGKLLADLSDHYPVKVKFKVTRTTTP